MLPKKKQEAFRRLRRAPRKNPQKKEEKQVKIGGML